MTESGKYVDDGMDTGLVRAWHMYGSSIRELSDEEVVRRPPGVHKAPRQTSAWTVSVARWAGMLPFCLLLVSVGFAAAGSNASEYQNLIKKSSDVEDREEIESLRLLPSALNIFDIDRILQALQSNTNISTACLYDMDQFIAGLRSKEVWAMRILDASGSYSSGYLFGSRFWLGSQTECLDLPNHVSSRPPFQVGYFSAKFQVNHNVSTHHQIITLGLCLPDNCTRDDLTNILQDASPSEATLKTIRPVPDKNYNFFAEIPLMIIASLITTAAVIVFVGTMYEMSLDRMKHRALSSTRNKQLGQITEATVKGAPLQFYAQGKSSRSNSLSSAESTSSVHSGSSCDSQEHKPGTFGQTLLCFSLKKNWKKISDTRGNEALGCVHGLRAFSMLWVIAGHTCMITVPFVDNIGFRIVVERDFLFQSIGNGAFSVDTFFFLSGLLIAFVFYKAEKSRNTEQSTLTHAKTSGLKLIGGITYRFIRLTPPYAVVMVLSYLLARWFIHNSIFDPPTGDMAACPTYWWRNLLYINTLFPVDQMCVIWSWYLADDTQFYVIGLIVLLLSTRYKVFATGATGVLLVIAWITTAVITLYTNHKPSVEEPLGLFDQLYDKPWTRFGPYVVGMAVGYYLAKINCQATFHKGLVVLGWALSMSTTFALVYGLYGELTQVQSAAYVALSHTAWALALSWVVIACVTGYGGVVNRLLCLKLFPPMSRLSYCAYLIHPLIMMSVVAHMEAPAHLQRDTMIIAIFGYAFASYLGSFVLTILFEAPAVALLGIFHPLKKKVK